MIDEVFAKACHGDRIAIAWIREYLELQAEQLGLPPLPGKRKDGRNKRKTHCINGHEFTPENTRVDQQGFRCCRMCERVKMSLRRRLGRDVSGFRDRAEHYGVAYEPIPKHAVYERDNWICGICHQKVEPDLKYPDPMSASLDHRIPMSRGGPHLYSNVQCSHLRCNMTKRNRLDT